MGGVRRGTEPAAGLAADGGRQLAWSCIPGYPDSIKAMAEAVRGAKNFVNAEFYIMSTDHVTDDLLTALEEAAERGVEVRVLFDHIGTLRIKGYRKLLKPAQGQQDPVAAHAAAAARPRPVAPAGPAEPPQDHGDRRRNRLHRIAEPDRALLQQPQAPQGGPRMGGADGPPARTDRHHAERRLRHRLAQRDRRIP